MLLRAFSRRDAILVLIGASSMHIWSLLFRSFNFAYVDSSDGLNQVNQVNLVNHVNQVQLHHTTSVSTVLTTSTSITVATATSTVTQTHKSSPTAGADEWTYQDLDAFLSSSSPSSDSKSVSNKNDDNLPPSQLVAHAPGWTLIRNLYMSNGTLYILLPPSSSGPTTPSLLSPDNSPHLHPEYYGPPNTKFAGKDMTYSYTKAPGWPEIRAMMSTGKPGLASRESEAEREPTPLDMQFLEMKEGKARWAGRNVKGGSAKDPAQEDRVYIVKGNTLLFNDPPQFLRHYYHFVAELFLGVQAFWSSAFSKPDNTNLANHFSTVWESSQSAFDASFSPSSSSPAQQQNTTTLPPIHRAIFIHSNADGWRDDPGFNSYFLRAVYPSLTVEHQEDWVDRVRASAVGVADGSVGERVWRFPLVLLTDRSAAHRGQVCGSRTQRTAAEAWDYMRRVGRLRGLMVGGWWAPVREAMWRFAGVDDWRKNGGVVSGSEVVATLDEDVSQGLLEVVEGMEEGGWMTPLSPESDDLKARSKVLDVRNEWQDVLPMPEEIVITYISRQSARHRKLLKADHDGLVLALKELVDRNNAKRERAAITPSSGPRPVKWTLDILEAEHLTKDAQVHAAARTTFMLGVHGNGLTHLVWMKPTRISTVIEMFCPGGFAHDYQWTSRSLGIRHWAVWNDTLRGGHLSGQDKPDISYPECFQGDEIPVWGKGVAKWIEERVEDALATKELTGGTV